MKSKLHFTFLFISLVVFRHTYAQISEFKITASDGEEHDAFGKSVSISGDYAVVGAWFDDGFRGSAYVFKRSGTTWVQEAKLLPSDGIGGGWFGVSASISGDYIIVGASGNNAGRGSAYVFKRTGTSWTEQAKLRASDGASIDFFGLVSISGDYAIVGAPADDDNGDASGSAYIFKRIGTSWVQEAKLLPSDGAGGDLFGASASISGDYAVVGARNSKHYVFKRTGTTWVQEAKLLPSEAFGGEPFVSLYGDYAALMSGGSAYVFKRTGTSWTQEAKLIPSDGASGFSVSISGDFAVLGARNSGSAFVFKRNGTSWTEEAKLIPSDGTAGDEFGTAVSISGDYAIVTAIADDDNGDDSGSAYLYTGFATAVGIENEKMGLPAEFALSQNYPNPFNPETVIEYTLSRSGDVSLIVYNLRGEEVALLIDSNMPAGNHRVGWDASNFASGIYFYRLQAGEFVQTRKMVLLR